jgi:hypothetical protein
LYDKIKISQGQPQLYGTQYKDDGLKKIQPNEGIQKVNDARIKIGLSPIASHLF